MPANYTYVTADLGFETFTITLYTTGTTRLYIRTIGPSYDRATDRFNPYAYAYCDITVQNIHLFLLRGETLPVAGTPYNYTVSCIRNGSLVTDGSWLPRVVFSTSGDDAASFPESNYTFTPADRGVRSFPITFSVDDARVLLEVFDDISSGAYRGELYVNERFTFYGDSSVIVSDGVAFNYTLSTKVGGVFQSPVRWTPNVYARSSDPMATLPGAIPGEPYQFDATDAAEAGHVFSFTLNTPGTHTIEFVAEDPYGNMIRKVVAATVRVIATRITATIIRVSGRNTQISLSATDADGEVDLTNTSTVSIASTDEAFVNGTVTPTDVTLVAGQVLITVASATSNTLTLSTSGGLTGATVTIP